MRQAPLALRLLILAVATVWLLAGCAKVELNLTVRPDGSADKEVLFALDKQLLALAASQGQDLLTQMQADAAKGGTTVSRYEETGKVGFRAVQTVPRLTAFDMNDKTWSGSFQTKNSAFWRDFTLNLNTNLDMPELKNPNAAPFLSQMEFKVSVALPAAIKEHNGQLDPSGRKVTWSLTPGTKDHLTLHARQYLWGRIAATGAGAVVVAGAIVLLAMRRRSRRASSGNSAA